MGRTFDILTLTLIITSHYMSAQTESKKLHALNYRNLQYIIWKIKNFD